MQSSSVDPTEEAGAGVREAALAARQPEEAAATTIAEAYVPAGATSFKVADSSGLSAGDAIEIQRPVTQAWVHSMQMDDLVRDGRPQTWIRTGSRITTERTIAAISGNRITLDIPLSDSFDYRYLNPPGTIVVKTKPLPLVSATGVEQLQFKAQR